MYLRRERFRGMAVKIMAGSLRIVIKNIYELYINAARAVAVP